MESRMKYGLALVALTLLVLALRLAVAFQTDLPSYESYFTLIQAESIRDTGLPRTQDLFSFGGRNFVVTPLYYYIIALVTLLMNEQLALKVVPNLFMALLVPLAYLIALNLTKSRWASLSAAFFAGFSPLIFTSYLNSAQPLSLALPVSAALLLALLELEQRPGLALLLTAVLILLSPIAWLFVGMYLVYILILASERLRIDAKYLEVALFTFLLAAWYTLIAYKGALYRYGIWTVASSLPQSVQVTTFAEFSFLTTVYAVGVVPLLLGSLAIYSAAFEARSRKVFLIAAFGLATLLAGALRLMPLRVSLLIVSFAFVVLAAPGLHLVSGYMKKTRLVLAHRFVSVAIFAVFILSSMLPALAAGIYPQSSPSLSEIEALAWIRNSTANTSVILASPKTGFLLNYEAQRPYVADEDYLLIANPNRILADIDEAYTTPSTVSAVELMEKYGVTHVVLGPRENSRYPEVGALLRDKTCFPVVHQNPQVLIFAVNCTREVGR